MTGEVPVNVDGPGRLKACRAQGNDFIYPPVFPSFATRHSGWDICCVIEAIKRRISSSVL